MNRRISHKNGNPRWDVKKFSENYFKKSKAFFKGNYNFFDKNLKYWL